ncbi:MAG: HDIG domain-containing protein [Gemmatimonadetes bacterium]|nr:HDIG domain-containing protein [Candidatus Palauibacter australiensis]
MLPTRDEALAIVHEYTESPGLRRHMLAVEAAMRAYARKYGEDEDRWGVAGLLHDFDYERWPNHDHASDSEHPSTGVAILRDKGVDEDVLETIMAHADYTEVEATTRMSKTLRAVDELTGFITACALVRPTRLAGMKTRSVRKKMKDKAFAAAISRDEMLENCAELGEDMGEHIAFVIAAMQLAAEDLGLNGPGGTRA